MNDDFWRMVIFFWQIISPPCFPQTFNTVHWCWYHGWHAKTRPRAFRNFIVFHVRPYSSSSIPPDRGKRFIVPRFVVGLECILSANLPILSRFSFRFLRQQRILLDTNKGPSPTRVLVCGAGWKKERSWKVLPCNTGSRPGRSRTRAEHARLLRKLPAPGRSAQRSQSPERRRTSWVCSRSTHRGPASSTTSPWLSSEPWLAAAAATNQSGFLPYTNAQLLITTE